jgi:hypothetical protein
LACRGWLAELTDVADADELEPEDADADTGALDVTVLTTV